MRLERRILEQGGELIVEHLHLAHRPVAHVDLDRTVVVGDRQAIGARLPRAQVQDVRLQRVQQAVRARVDVEIARPLAVLRALLEQVLELAPQPAETGHERVARGRLAARTRAPRPHVTEVLARRAEQEQVRLDSRGQRREHAQIERRQVRDAEHAQPLR